MPKATFFFKAQVGLQQGLWGVAQLEHYIGHVQSDLRYHAFRYWLCNQNPEGCFTGHCCQCETLHAEAWLRAMFMSDDVCTRVPDFADKPEGCCEARPCLQPCQAFSRRLLVLCRQAGFNVMKIRFNGGSLSLKTRLWGHQYCVTDNAHQ